MNHPRLIAVIATLLCLCASAPAEVALDFKYDRPFFLDVRHVAKQEFSALGQKKVSDVSIRMVFEVRRVKADGAATVLEHTVLHCEDVSTEEGGEREEGTFAGLRGQAFRVVLAPNNRSLEIDGVDKLLDPVFGDEAKQANAVEKRFMKDVLSAVLKVHLQDAYVPTPGKPAAPGETWKVKTQMKLQGLVQMDSDRTFTLKQPRAVDGKQLHAIEWSSRAAFKALPGNENILPFAIKEVSQVGDPVDQGTVLWDAAAGRPASAECRQEYELKIKIEVDGEKLEGTGKGKDTFSIRFSDEKPDVEAKKE